MAWAMLTAGGNDDDDDCGGDVFLGDVGGNGLDDAHRWWQ